MEELAVRHISQQSLLDSVSQQVAVDLANLLKNSNQIKNRIRFITEKIGIDKKTLSRLIEQKGRPNYITVLKIYRFILSEYDDSLLMEKVPSCIRDYLKQANPENLKKHTTKSTHVDEELRRNPIYLEIYVLAGTGPITAEEIQQRYGAYGLKIIHSMLQAQVLVRSQKNSLVLGPHQAALSPESFLQLGLALTHSFAKPQNSYELDKNVIAFYAEGLSTAAYQEWLRIDQLAFREKIKIAEQDTAKGDCRAFTFLVTDTFVNPSEENKERVP